MMLVAWLGIAGASAAAAAAEERRGAKAIYFDPDGESFATEQPSSTDSGVAAGDGAEALNTDPVGRGQAERPGGRSLGVRYWVEMVDENGKEAGRATAGRVFYSGERIRLHVESNVDGHVALYQVGSGGTASLLYPAPDKGLTKTRVAARSDVVLPSPTHWMRFDDVPGTERLVVIFAESRAGLVAVAEQAELGPAATTALLERSRRMREGSKALLIETHTAADAETGTYAVSLGGEPVVLEVVLDHRSERKGS